MDVIECATCGRWFNNTDNTRVCPNGHENDATDDEDHIPARKVTG